MARDLLALAELFEAKARALRDAHAILADVNGAAAVRALPQKLRAASRHLQALGGDDDAQAPPPRKQKRGPYGKRPKAGPTITQQIIDHMAIHGPSTYPEITATGLNASGNLTHLMSAGFVTREGFQKPGSNRIVYRYTLTDAGRARASGGSNGHHSEPHQVGMEAPTPENDPAGRYRAAETRRDESAMIRGPRLTVFLLSAIRDRVQSASELVEALRAAGHPMGPRFVLNGPLAKLTSSGWIRRNPKDRTFQITTNGRKRLAAQVAEIAEDLAADQASTETEAPAH